jgi:two-component system, sensor histidine kinase and response regulator
MTAETILVVEDDAALLDGLRDILELSGYRVVTARNGAQGLLALEQHRPDLIVSDINMPRMDGYQFYGQVRAHPEWVSLPFIFLTAKGEKADIRRGKMLGVDDYITKPFEEADLLVAVQAKLNRRDQLNAARDRQISDLKRTILTTLNHEFRTPLTYITTYADMLREGNVSAEDFKNFMRGIQVGSDRLRRLVEDFIFLVELQTGEAQQTYERRRQPLRDLASLLQTEAERYQPRARERGVSLEVSLASSLPEIVGDAEFLSNAIGRLLDNAIKFSKKGGGKVVLRAQPGDQSLIIEVADDGIGMPAAELAKIFDVFHQIDRAKMEQQGSGSGLAITHGVVSLHGGRLTATSEVDQGSTFRIELPLAPV